MNFIKKMVFTAFYAGYCPVAPGTAGTVVGMLIYILEFAVFPQKGWIVNAALVIILLFPCIKIGDAGERFFGEKDPPRFVLDEVMGYWISVLFFPFSWTVTLSAFVLFRILDISKPFPIRQLQDLRGGMGVMFDDYVAGIYTNLILWGIVFTAGRLDIPIY